MTASWVRGDWISRLTGRQRLLFGFAGGALSATGFAPIEFFPALLLAYALLVLLMDGACAEARPIRCAAAVGWAFCFGQFLVGWHWIGYAFLVDPADHLWQMPLALVGLTAGMALYGALACGLIARLWRPGPARILLFAASMAGAQWLRGHLFTGFPWNLSAYGWGVSLALLQSASLMGAYGLSFLTILLGASLAELLGRRWLLPLLLALLFVGLWSYGAYRLAATPQSTVAGVRLRLVQPDVPQAQKYVPGLMLRNWQRLIDLSLRPPEHGQGLPTHIIWPEAATGFAVARSPGALAEIALFTARGQTVMTGSDRVVEGRDRLTAFNSLYIFGPAGAAPTVYDKFHLVPFGEYVPFAHFLNKLGISQLAVGEGFSTGDHPHLVSIAGAPAASPLICYEVIFPGAVTDPHAPRPGWLINITDDAWFGPWAGPRQHFLIARVRAIEEGLPLARAANTGISAVIDGNGRVLAELGLNRMGVVDWSLPAALPPTPYGRFGDLIFWLFLVSAVFANFLLRRR